MISLKQLKYFDAVARLGQFGRAADQCSITQPALSMQIADLERELGVTLIERRPRGAVLTEVGRQIAARAARVLAEVRDLEELARQATEPLSGPLRLGVIPTIAPYLLPALVPRVRQSFPEIELHIRETQTHTLIAELLDGTLDCLLLALPLQHSELETLALADDHFLLAMPKSKRLPARIAADAQLLAGDRLLLLEEGHCLRDQALSYCQLRQVSGLDTFGASSLSTIVQMVASGMGVTLLPEIAIDLETRRADLALLRFKSPEPKRQIGLAWRATSPRRCEFQALADVIMASIPPRRLKAFRAARADAPE